jgi:hypothetical protein
LLRRSSLESSFGHPGRYAPSRAHPQVSSIARGLARWRVRRSVSSPRPNHAPSNAGHSIALVGSYRGADRSRRLCVPLRQPPFADARHQRPHAGRLPSPLRGKYVRIEYGGLPARD